jgi:hypothetical protein
MMGLALRGFINSAIQVLKQCSFNEEQAAKIQNILRNVLSGNAEQTNAEMKGKILAVLTGEDLKLEIAPSEPAFQIIVTNPETGPGIGQPPANYQNQIHSLQTRSHNMTDQLCDDILQLIFLHCQSQSDWKSIGALTCVNQHYKRYATKKYWKQFDLKLFWPELTILDAKAQGMTIYDEPQISKLAILKYLQKLAPHVENNEGLTLLTMCKGLTLNQLFAIAKQAGIKVSVWDEIVKELGDVPVEQTYVILITNSVFNESRRKIYDQQKELVSEHGCEMPTVQEYVALCVFTNKFFQKCLYGQNPWTFGRSSTHVKSYPLVVGGFAPASLCVRTLFEFTHENYGAGGQRKF